MTHPFLRDEPRQRLKKAVEAVEARSAAEIMVVVRPWSAHYRHVDLAAGAALAFIMLIVALFAPVNFTPWQVVIEVAVAFVVGGFLMAFATPVRLALAGSKHIDQHVQTAAEAHFTRLGVDRTRDRSGVLVYVSLLEQRCHAVPDVGVTNAMTDDEWTPLANALNDAVAQGGVGPEGAARLAVAIEALGDPLETGLPRREDDINELPDLDH